MTEYKPFLFSFDKFVLLIEKPLRIDECKSNENTRAYVPTKKVYPISDNDQLPVLERLTHNKITIISVL